jgi:hypothetical protein
VTTSHRTYCPKDLVLDQVSGSTHPWLLLQEVDFNPRDKSVSPLRTESNLKSRYRTEQQPIQAALRIWRPLSEHAAVIWGAYIRRHAPRPAVLCKGALGIINDAEAQCCRQTDASMQSERV